MPNTVGDVTLQNNMTDDRITYEEKCSRNKDKSMLLKGQHNSRILQVRDPEGN